MHAWSCMRQGLSTLLAYQGRLTPSAPLLPLALAVGPPSGGVPRGGSPH